MWESKSCSRFDLFQSCPDVQRVPGVGISGLSRWSQDLIPQFDYSKCSPPASSSATTWLQTWSKRRSTYLFTTVLHPTINNFRKQTLWDQYHWMIPSNLGYRYNWHERCRVFRNHSSFPPLASLSPPSSLTPITVPRIVVLTIIYESLHVLADHEHSILFFMSLWVNLMVKFSTMFMSWGCGCIWH